MADKAGGEIRIPEYIRLNPIKGAFVIDKEYFRERFMKILMKWRNE